ncbi:unnamed protein product [Clonostachys solani]|uniref:Solute carrier family 28 member 3 n=1 Tax=Clonostachys solani TaxID=160281 RepID=A0A9P0EMS7_9HYPO|nr:unnamed protein product [Clonostachys solani]
MEPPRDPQPGDTSQQTLDSHPIHPDIHKASDGAISKKSIAEEHVDVSLGEPSAIDDPNQDRGGGKSRAIGRFYSKYRLGFHILFWMVWTAWWIHGLVFHRSDALGWLIPFLLYLAVTLRFIFWWIPIETFWAPVRVAWAYTFRRVYDVIPSKFRQPAAAAFTVAVFLTATFIPAETGVNTRPSRAISLFGLVVMIAGLYATSRDRKRIQWHTVIGGMLTQFVIALFVLKTKPGYDIFAFISSMARTLLTFASDGVVFLTSESVASLPWFLIGVVPPIIFFVSLVTLLYHFGILQWFIKKLGRFFFWILRVSGAEAVVAASTPFVGQGESAMLIRPFIPYLTHAEIHQVMTCGFATISGSMLVAYIGLGLNPQALVSSCIMSIPASLAISKMRYPETEEPLTSGYIVVPEVEEDKASNALHDFANGAWLGLKIAGMIVTTLLCIISFVALVNGFLTWISHVSRRLAPWSPVPGSSSFRRTPRLKIVANEFVAFSALSHDEPFISMNSRTRLLATYACCGFGNIGSLGTQIGVLSQIAPGRSGAISRVAVSALVSGIIATLTSASVAGMLLTDDAMIG